jgi:NitT/TauT family transport system substrate-binding protein
MMREIGLLVEGGDGRLDEEAYQRTVDTLLAGGSDPVISQIPEGAFTHEITDRALAE